jgi:hypothetical protein
MMVIYFDGQGGLHKRRTDPHRFVQKRPHLCAGGPAKLTAAHSAGGEALRFLKLI